MLNRKKLYRLYKEERLTVRKRGGRKRALGTRAPMAVPQGINQRWSLDFVSDALTDGRRFRILAVIDDFNRECVGLVADVSLSGVRVARELDQIAELRGYPCLLVSDNGTELTSNAILKWQEERRVELALHRARQADAEWLCRKLYRALSRRMPERAPVRQPETGAPDHRSLASRLQRTSALTRALTGSPQPSLQPAPRRGITRTDSTYERGHIGEQVTHSKACS